MRLAILVSHPIQYYAPLFRELAQRVDIEVLYAHRATPEDQAKAGFGVRLQWDVDLLQGYPHRFLRNAAKRPGLDHFAGVDAPEIGKVLAEGRFDALLVMGWHLKAYVQGILAAKRLRLPVMVRGDSQLHTPRAAWKQRMKALLYPPLLRLFDAALYVGQRSRDYYRHYRYPEERLFFSPHCVDNAWFASRATPQARQKLRQQLGIGEKAKVVLFAGKLQPFKRPLDVTHACARLRREGMDVHMLVAGAGKLQDALQEAAKGEQLPLHLLGFCNQTRMPQAYAAADVLVLPSDGRETWGLVVNEAMACGLPAVVSDAVGCGPDLVIEGQTGAIFPTGDVPALAAAVARVLDIGRHAPGIIEKMRTYSLQGACEGILQGLNHVIRDRQGR